jgi:hypothetical protein
VDELFAEQGSRHRRDGHGQPSPGHDAIAVLPGRRGLEECIDRGNMKIRKT